MLRVLFFIAIAGFTFDQVINQQEIEHLNSTNQSAGFVTIMMPVEAEPNSVLILAPQNCSSAAGKRADVLETRLTELGIPNKRSSSFNVNITDSNEETIASVQRTEKILKGKIPAVFFAGLGKSNPSAEEVVREFQLNKKRAF